MKTMTKTIAIFTANASNYKQFKLQIMKNLVLLSILILLFASCTVQKRLHQNGYYVDFKNNNRAIQSSNSNLTQIKKNNEYEINSDNYETLIDVESDKISNNSEISIIEIKQDKVKPNLIIESDNIEVVSQQENTVHEQIEISKNSSKNQKNHQTISKKQDKKTASSSDSGSGKSQIVALILCILLGWLGIHRFYLGYTGLGIIYILTFGLFGIGWLIDLFLLIIPNGLSPKGRTSYRK